MKRQLAAITMAVIVITSGLLSSAKAGDKVDLKKVDVDQVVDEAESLKNDKDGAAHLAWKISYPTTCNAKVSLEAMTRWFKQAERYA